MSDIHITRELLRAIAKGELPPRVLTQAAWDHLLSLCPDCREEYQAFRAEQTSSLTYETALRALPVVVERQAKDFNEKRERRSRDVRDLLKLPQEERLLRIGRANTRFRGVTLAHMLLEKAKLHMPAEPQRVFEYAETAYTILLRTSEVPGINDALVRSLGFMGNALRAQGNLAEAAQRIAGARGIIRQHGVTDPLVYAELDWFEGNLRQDQRRFREAKEHLTRSAALYNLAGKKVEAARSLIQLGSLHYYRDELDQAAEVTKAALTHFTAEAEPRLYLCARHNLALFLCEAGNYAGAAAAMHTAEAFYREFSDRFTRLRHLWLSGKIAYGFGDLAEAEEVLRAVHQGFIEAGIGYDVAMVSLDIALLYLKQGRTAELKVLAAEMSLVFESQEVHREAAAALVLFQQAVEQERLTAKVVEDMVRYLRRARTDPTLRFKRIV